MRTNPVVCTTRYLAYAALARQATDKGDENAAEIWTEMADLQASAGAKANKIMQESI